MPYCLTCGTKTDFETDDCPSCGEVIRRRIDPPGEKMVAQSRPTLHWDEESTADDDGSELSGGQTTDPKGNGAIASDAGDDVSGDIGKITSEDAVPPETSLDEVSPFADRWSISFAASYPNRGDYRPLLLGGVLEFLALVVPLFTLLTGGYGFRLLRATARGQEERPGFDDFGALLVDGLKICLIGAIYTGLLLFGVVAAVIAQSVDGPFGVAVWATVLLLGVYPLPASLTVYGATDDLRAAFSRSYAGELATSWTYLKAWIAWLVSIALFAAFAVVSVITLVGPLVVRAWGIYSMGALWGYYYREAAARGVVPPAPDEPVA